MDFYKKIKTFREVLSQIEAPVKETHETHWSINFIKI